MSEATERPTSVAIVGPDLTTMSVGDELPTLVKHPTTRQLVMYAGASGDFYELHYDDGFARRAGLDGVIVHGLLKAGWLSECVTSWAGPDAFVRSVEISYRGMDVPDVDFEVNATIAAIDRQDDGSTLVEVDMRGGPSGSRTTIGKIIVQIFGDARVGLIGDAEGQR
jgi:acyl dehydratase